MGNGYFDFDSCQLYCSSRGTSGDRSTSHSSNNPEERATLEEIITLRALQAATLVIVVIGNCSINRGIDFFPQYKLVATNYMNYNTSSSFAAMLGYVDTMFINLIKI